MAFLTRNGGSQVFQIRVPRRFDPALTLAPIRLTLGSLPNSQARPLATALAGLAQVEFARKMSELRNEAPATVRDDVARSLKAAMPVLLGLGALKPGALSPAIADKATTAAFDALIEIGGQRAAGQGVFAQDGIHYEKPFVEALRSENGARDLLGLKRVPEMVPTGAVDRRFAEMSEQIAGLQQIMLARLGPAPDEPSGPLFSVAADKAIELKRRTHGARHPDVSALARRKAVFITLVGDRPVDAYKLDDLQDFVDALSWTPPNVSKMDGVSLVDLPDIVRRNRETQQPGLARNTIESYVNRLRAIILEACRKAEVTPRCTGRICMPQRAAPPKTRLAPDLGQIAKVFDRGIDSGILSDALLIPLGLLTGRRIGLLAFMHREDIRKYQGKWCVFPQAQVIRDGKVVVVPFKTEESLEHYVLHDVFERCGFVAWAKQTDGPVFEQLMKAHDPADTAQKRMSRLYSSAGVDPAIASTFHALRAGKIRAERERRTDPRVLRLQVGHETNDIHEGYDPVLTDADLQHLAEAPLPAQIAWSRLYGLDFEAFARKVPKGGRPPKDK